MQLLPNNLKEILDAYDANKVLNEAAQRKYNQIQAAHIGDYLDKQIRGMDLNNQINEPKARHSEEMVMAELKDKIAEAFMKRAQGGLFGAETNYKNIESQFLPAKSRADIADAMARANFNNAQANNELYKNNPNLGAYEGLNNFIKDQQIDPEIKRMALGGQLGQLGSQNGVQIPFKEGYGSQGNDRALGSPSALQKALMTSDQIKTQNKINENQDKEWEKYMDKIAEQSAAADKISYLAPLFLNAYKKGRKNFIPSTGSLAYLSMPDQKTNKFPLGGIFADPNAQLADNLSSQIQALIAKTEIGSPNGRTPTNMQLGLAGRMKFNPTMQPAAAEQAVNLAVKNANIIKQKSQFFQNQRKHGFSKNDAEIHWANYLNKKLFVE